MNKELERIKKKINKIDPIEESIDEREVKDLESWTLVPHTVTGRKQFLVGGFLASGL